MPGDNDNPTDKLIPDDICFDDNDKDIYIDESGTTEVSPWDKRPSVHVETPLEHRRRVKALTKTLLTPMEEQFVIEYVVDKNQTKAAIRAGYSEKTARTKASWLMQQHHIQVRIKQQLDRLKKRIFNDAEVILQDIYDIGTRCMEKEPVLDKDGNAIGVWKFDSQGALRSRELLGKHLELFTDKVKQQGETVLNIVVNKDDPGKLEKH